LRCKEGVGEVVLLVWVVGLVLVLGVVRVIWLVVIRIGCLRWVSVVPIVVASPLCLVDLFMNYDSVFAL